MPDVFTTASRPLCPECNSAWTAAMERMRRFSGTHDWFRCDGCGHLFTIERSHVLELMPSQTPVRDEDATYGVWFGDAKKQP